MDDKLDCDGAILLWGYFTMGCVYVYIDLGTQYRGVASVNVVEPDNILNQDRRENCRTTKVRYAKHRVDLPRVYEGTATTFWSRRLLSMDPTNSCRHCHNHLLFWKRY